MSETYTNFVFYKEWLDQLMVIAKGGTTEDLAALCSGLKSFLDGETPEDLTPLASMMLNQMTSQIERDKGHLKEISDKRRQNREGKTKDNKTEQNTTNDNKTEQNTSKQGVEEEVEVEEDVSTSVDKNTLTVSERELRDEFESIWLAYPRKVGKKDAYRHYRSARKNGTTFDEVYNGVLKYRKSVSDTDEQYIAHGSAWFCGHRWEDDITGTPRAKPKKQLTAEEILAIPAINPWSEP